MFLKLKLQIIAKNAIEKFYIILTYLCYENKVKIKILLTNQVLTKM